MTTGILIEGLRKRYGQGDTAVDALKHVDMQVAPGEVVGLIGPSGSGKSTLLKCLGAIIDPSAGRMTLGDEVIYDDGWKVRDLRALRREPVGQAPPSPFVPPVRPAQDRPDVAEVVGRLDAAAGLRVRGIDEEGRVAGVYAAVDHRPVDFGTADAEELPRGVGLDRGHGPGDGVLGASVDRHVENGPG